MTDSSLSEKTGNEFAEAFMETAPVGILVCDERGRITRINALACRYFGYERDELIEKDVEILLPHRLQREHIESRAAYAKSPSPRAIGQGRELVGLRKDGTEFPIEIALMPLRTANGAMTTAVMIDPTERRKAQGYTRVSQQLEAVQQLAAAMANEFNNIFAAILGNMKLAIADLAWGAGPASNPVGG